MSVKLCGVPTPIGVVDRGYTGADLVELKSTFRGRRVIAKRFVLHVR